MCPSVPAATAARQSPRIRRDVGIDDGPLALTALPRVAVLHADNSLEALRVNVAEDVPIIDLAGARLAPARIVADLEIRDFIPGGVHVRDQVSFSDLLVVDVKQDLARRTPHGATDLERLRDLVEELTGVVSQR